MGLAAFNRWRRDEGVEGAGREHRGTVTDGEKMEAPKAETVTDAPEADEKPKLKSKTPKPKPSSKE